MKKNESKQNQEIFKGKQKTKVSKTSLGENIRVKRNPLTKIPERVVQINLYPASLKKGTVPVTSENVERTFKEFFREHKQFLGIDPDALKIVTSKKINRRWFVKYHQYYKGILIHNATVGIESSDGGKVATYAANYYPDINIDVKPDLDMDKAIDIALKTYKTSDRSKLKRKDDTLIIYPEESEQKITYHLAWKFLIIEEEPNPDMDKCFIVDAKNGTILSSYPLRFPGAQVTGKVQGEVYPANPTDTIATVPIGHEHVDIKDAGEATTNSSGIYKKTVSWFWELFNFLNGQATFRLEGPYVRVQDIDGSDFTEVRSCDTNSPCNLTWTATDRDHINVFYHMNLFHDWLKDELGYSWINPWSGSSRFNARVNDPRNNAYSGDPMLFGTNNYARSSDVIYHECTHNILYEIYGDWIGYPATHIEAYAMDEGFADYFSCSFTNESRHGEGCSANPRDLNNNMQYPGKGSYNIEGHTGGTIIGGAAWEFRQRLVDIYGTAGARIADQLILEAHQILSTFPRGYFFSDPGESNLLSALYKAADIDNDLLNGFPYFTDIQLAFHAHGLLQAVLSEDDSFDFSTNIPGTLTGGDFYYSGGKFWANNIDQKGVIDLGDIGDADLTTVSIPTTGYTRQGVTAVQGHTYVSKAQKGESGSFIAFHVDAVSGDKSNVTISYFYRLTPYWYIANINSLEIHKPNCNWVSLMAPGNKMTCKGLDKVADLIQNNGYNGCHYCLPRYDTDTLSKQKVLENLNEDLA